jgi:hypothetical protein
MPRYVTKTLKRFENSASPFPQYSPHILKDIKYGAAIQFAKEPDQSPPIAPNRVRRLQQIVGTLLYYVCANDSTMFAELSSLVSAQPSTSDKKSIPIALDYNATNPETSVSYQPSKIILNIHSSGSYLSETQDCSRAGGIFFMSDKRSNNNPISTLNGAIHVKRKIMKSV